jgi:hypothetical protein
VGLVLCPGVQVLVWYCVRVCNCGSGTVSGCVTVGLVLCPGAQVCDFCILKLTESDLSETYWSKNETRLTVLSKSRDE